MFKFRVRPEITVVTVVFNAESLIEKTLKSVLGQRKANFEYIVIDGNSTDGTSSIIDKYRRKITRVISEPDEGIYDAMNKAISIAEGTWINFINAGDTFCSRDTLSSVQRELDEEHDFVYGDRYRVNEDGEAALEHARPVEESARREAVYHQSLFSRTGSIKPGFNTAYSLAADYELVVRSWAAGAKFKKIDLPICYFLEGGRSRKHYIKAHLEAMHILYDKLPDTDSWHRSDFATHFLITNFSKVVNRSLRGFEQTHPEFQVSVCQDDCGGLVFKSKTNVPELNKLLGRLTHSFSGISANIELPTTLEDQKGTGSAPSTSSGQVEQPTQQTTSTSVDLPRLTVITVVYNAVKEIEETITSVLLQDYSNLEYIVINGLSTDGTSDVIDRYLQDISQYINERDDGIYDAMNKGIAASTGEYVLFMNAGDTFYDTQSLSQLARHIGPACDVVYGDRLYIKANGSEELQCAKSIDTVFERMPYCHQSALVSTNVLRELPFNVTYKYAADYNQVVEMYRAGKRFKHVDIPVCRFSEGGLSESGIRPYLEVLKIQFDNCNDPEIIRDRSKYFSAFRNNADKLMDI